MLGKMIVHGVVAAAIVGGTAAIYAQVTNNGSLFPQVAQAEVGGLLNGAATFMAKNDEPRSAGAERRGDDRDRSVKSDRHRDRHDRKHDHDDDDD